MGDVSNNFSRHEFGCKCGCGFDAVDFELRDVVQKVRDYYGKPVTINSGCRCLKYNRSIESTDNSQHIKAKAADISIAGVLPAEIFSYLDNEYPHKYGIGLYQTFVHIDVRKVMARW